MTDETTPEFGGKCALGVALEGPNRAPAGKDKYKVERDGKVYYLSNAPAKWLFQAVPGFASRAAKKAASA
jgi:YHS domain-containing protein